VLVKLQSHGKAQGKGSLFLKGQPDRKDTVVVSAFLSSPFSRDREAEGRDREPLGWASPDVGRGVRWPVAGRGRSED
jgi:hypothetical protein